MKKINVLITGAGAPGIAGTIYALKNNPEHRCLKIVTADINKNAVGRYLSDSFYEIPKPENHDFLPKIMDICKKESIDVILPQVTKELPVFAAHLDFFKSEHVGLVVNPSEKMDIANDKYNLSTRFINLGFEQGLFALIKNNNELFSFAKRIGYPESPFVVKLPVSNGMRGFRVVSEKQLTLQDFIDKKPSGETIPLKTLANLFDQGLTSLLGMEYCPGIEYSVDVYRSPLSKKTITIPRSRTQIRSGITFEGTLENHRLIRKMSEKLAENLDLNYCFGFQFKLNKDNQPVLLECNPRIQGTMVMSVMGGANMIFWAVKEALGEEVDLTAVQIKWGMDFKRYWSGVAIHDGFVELIG